VSDALIAKSVADIMTATPQPSMTNQINVSGSGNTINGFVDKLIIINQGASSKHRTVNASHCNIFVLKSKNFRGNCFSILRSRVYVEAFDAVNVTSYPSLFITANDEYIRCTDANQQFYYGFVNDIEDEPHSSSVKIYYDLRSTQPLYQRDLNPIFYRLGISPIRGKDVLGETGWTICSIDIVKALSDECIDMTTY
jgi:hypothetical protein